MSAHLDEPTISVAEAARLAGKSASTLRNQIGEGVLPLAQTDLNSVPGGTRLLTARRVLQIVIAAQLERMGVAPRQAARWALSFSDFGADSSAEGWTPDNAGLARAPGELFSGAYTWLVAHPHHEGARIVAVGADKSALTLLIGPDRVAMPAFVLPLNHLVAHLQTALGLTKAED